MLWETVDAEDALRTRFGFDGLAAAVEWMSTVHEAWAVTVSACDRLVISGRNVIAWVETSRGRSVVKWSGDPRLFAGLAASARLLGQLDGLGLPVAAPLAAADGQVRVVRDGPLGPLSVAVLPEVVGDWLDIRDDAAVRGAGACLAELHEALHGYHDDRLWPATESTVSRDQIHAWVANRNPGSAPSTSERLRALLADLPPLDDEMQLVHNDFRSANILTRDSKIIAVLDFDDLAWTHRVCDLAKASVYLGTLFTDWQPSPHSVQHELRAGYESVRPLGAAEDRWLDALTLWYELGFA